MTVLALGCSAIIALPLAGCNNNITLFLITSLVACNQRLEKNFICLYMSCHLSACNILSPPLRSKSSLPRPRPRQQRSIDINGAISDACQDAVRSSNYLRLSQTSNHVPFLLLSSYFCFYRRILETVGVPQQSAPNNLLNPASYWHSCFQYRTTSGNSV